MIYLLLWLALGFGSVFIPFAIATNGGTDADSQDYETLLIGTIGGFFTFMFVIAMFFVTFINYYEGE